MTTLNSSESQHALPAVISGCRRFTCLSPTLVRMEYAPDGVFEERRSLVAYAPQQPRPFQHIREHEGTLTLETEALTLISQEQDTAFFPANIEVRWIHDGLLQFWRPGDRDYGNLGGTVRSLDRYGNLLTIEGVHPADMESPDAYALSWLAWLQCEEDPPYYAQSPEQRPGLNGDFQGSVKYGLRQLLARTHNYILESLRYSPGILSRSGYCFLNDSVSPLLDADDWPVERRRPGYQDWYFFAYGADYQQALRDFILLTGHPLLPTRNTFGLMFCRWPAPDEREAKQIVEEFQQHGTPLSTLIIDMEWHQEGWGHWDWNEAMYPDPAGFFHWCHERGMQVALNDHPLDVRSDDSHFNAYLEQTGTAARVRQVVYNNKSVEMIDVDMGQPGEVRAFLDICHRHVVQQGIDFWWNDGCKGRLNGAINQLLCNKAMYEDVQNAENRGMLLARYGGLGSHRYGVFFTGDTLSCWEVLREQCEFTIRAGHLGMALVSHDIGGFFMPHEAPLLDPQLFLRWVQFGVFSPVFRFHSAPGSGSRKPWDYGAKIGGAACTALQVRNSLIPYLYTAARRHHDTGVPIVRGLFLEHPEDLATYRFDEYYFGPDMIVAPILSAESYRTIYLPAGDWYRFETAQHMTGGHEWVERGGNYGIPVFVKAGSILVRQHPALAPLAPHVEHLWLDVYPGGESEAELYEDDGKSPRYAQGDYCRTRFHLRQHGEVIEITGAVAEGSPLGQERRITIDIALDAAPAIVLLNGATPVNWETSTPANRYRISLPVLAAAQPFTIRIDLGKEHAS